MKIVIRYSHERIKPDCRASEKFTVETPVPQDGFYIPQALRCAWCNVDAYVESAVLVENEGPHSRACGWRFHDHGPACHENCPTCGGKSAPPATIENLRSKPADRIESHNGDSKIEQYRDVRAELSRTLGMDDFARVPVKDGTPLSRKMFVETLCVAQSRIGNSPYDEDRKKEHIARLQVLIDIFSDRGRNE